MPVTDRVVWESQVQLFKSAGSGNQESVQELLRLCPEFKALAEAGDTRSRTMLAVIFMLYVDAPQETIELLSKSSDEGDPVAQRTLAFPPRTGQGVAVD